MGRPRKTTSVTSIEPPERLPTTPEEVERLNIGYAADLARRQLRDGTVSAQVHVHYLKLGTKEAALQLKNLEADFELKKARVEQIANTEKMAEMFEEAIKAMVTYQGGDPASVNFEDFHTEQPGSMEIEQG